jgi:ubiquitin-small subunit ribosomal protein S27Ae
MADKKAKAEPPKDAAKAPEKAAPKKEVKKAVAKKDEATSKGNYYTVNGSKLERKRRPCPKCGAGVFLAEHENRTACGKCGYTEFKNKK